MIMNKEKVFAWIESLEDMADQSDRYFVERTKLYKENQEKDKEIERLRKREKKWEKWTTEKEILSTKMSEYLCKWKNIKREYKNQVESNRLKKQKIERLNNIIDELEKFFKYAYDNEVKPLNDRKISVWTICLDKLKKLKEGKE